MSQGSKTGSPSKIRSPGSIVCRIRADLVRCNQGNGPVKSSSAQRELRLAKLAQKGDQAAFEMLVCPHLRKIYFVTLKITRSREDAEDASQQAFLKALANICQFRGRAQFSTWLTRIAMNQALMVVRKRRSEDCRFIRDIDLGTNALHEENIRAVDTAQPEAIFAAREKQRLLLEAIGNLRVAFRKAVWLLGIEEHSCAEVADVLNLSQPALKTRLSRARLVLRQCLDGRI